SSILFFAVFFIFSHGFGQITYTVTNTNDSGEGSLRQAIINANASSITDNIFFNINGAGSHTIQLNSALPAITQTVVLDATTQPGYSSGNPVIIIDGNAVPGDGFWLTTATSGSVIKGFVLGGFSSSGRAAIYANSSGGHIITGNFIGIAANGTTAMANTFGIYLQNSSGNTIGGTSINDRNLIAGNSTGLQLVNSGSSDNRIQGNFFGTDKGGSYAVSNGNNIVVSNAPNNLIGGTDPGEMNLISGAIRGTLGIGVTIAGSGSTGNRVLGNYIGTDITGNIPIRNGFAGIFITAGASQNIIGSVNGGNVISGNFDPDQFRGNGIQIDKEGTNGNRIVGNRIGTNAAGTAALPNLSGIDLQDGSNNTVIGGTLPGEGNLISGNRNSGIEIGNSPSEAPNSSNNNIILGNLIGSSADGLEKIPNTVGITLSSSQNNQIGGTGQYEGNLLSGNNNHGLGIYESSGNNVTGNDIGISTTGTILGNGSRGIWIDGSAATNNVIAGNTISGNGSIGVVISTGASSNTLSGNFIGTNRDGTGAIPNNTGVSISNAPSNFIGGTATLSRNVISGNNSNGINITGAEAKNNLINGNYIGTNASGTGALPNFRGINLSGGSLNTVGGTTQLDRNIISGNTDVGVYIQNSRENNFFGNFIGTTANGLLPLPSRTGILIINGSDGNKIGGLNAGEENLIANNTIRAVFVTFIGGIGGADPLNNQISGNRIYSNNFGIDLGSVGVTANDPDDADDGPNLLQNFPEILDQASFDGTNINLKYFVPSAPANSAYPIRVEFFINDGNRQGKEFLFSQEFTETDYNNGPFKEISFPLPAGSSFVTGDLILATATDANGNTSEFGASVSVTEEITEYTLTVTTQGNGSVSKAPDQEKYTAGTTVELTATADEGWVFDRWEEDLTGNTNPETITMDSNKAVTAVFTEVVVDYTLAISVEGQGSVAASPNQETYVAGTEVTLTATAAAGWEFSGWTGDLSGNTNPETITMDSNKAVTAVFTEVVVDYTLAISVEGQGSVGASPNLAKYVAGTEVTLTATAAAGWEFSG
ncbi:MAG TPA: NosD domain-containing protein, partial [Gillisia sp.]|nr:NosD domain-containing protein [Gillisia sp.]